MEIPKEFFTLQSMLTLAGASGATFVVCNGLQVAFNFNPKWLALLVAQVIVLVGTAVTGASGIADYMVGIINGFLVFLVAVGGTSAAGGSGGTPSARGASSESTMETKPGRRRFLTPWF